MNPKHRSAIFLATAFALMLPYLAFVMYYALQIPSGQWPMWVMNTLLVWFAANFLILMLVARKIFKKHEVEPERVRRASTIAKMFSGYLLILWSLLFLYGVKETIEGDVPFSRALPADAFLLFFIAVFGTALYRANRRKA